MIMFFFIAILMVVIGLFFILPTLLGKKERRNDETSSAALNLAVLRDQMSELDADLKEGTVEAEAYASSMQDLQQRTLEDVRPAVVPAVVTGGGVITFAVAQYDSENASTRENFVGFSDRTVAPETPAQVLQNSANSQQEVQTNNTKKSYAKWLSVVIPALLPVIAFGLYFLLGSPKEIANIQTQTPAMPENVQETSPAQTEKLIAVLLENVKAKPNDANSWDALARHYHSLKRFAESADAYAHLVKLVPDDASLLADYADTLAMSLNRSLLGEPEKLIARALVADPKHIKALALAGSAAYEKKDFNAAAGYWKRILPLVPPDSEMAKSTLSNVNEAESLAGGKALPVAATSEAPAGMDVAENISVEGSVDIDQLVRRQVTENDTVFIFVRAASGPKFPLAVLRKQVKDLPMNFHLMTA
jgi:cytochrome c-type biogenesis protein CcmH